MPQLPANSKTKFDELNDLISQNEEIALYLTNRLAAVGGTGVESLTRRMMRYIMTNDVAMLYNWKGRDKEAFHKTAVMKLIYDAAKTNFPQNQRTALAVENTVKDWLKQAKHRFKHASK